MKKMSHKFKKKTLIIAIAAASGFTFTQIGDANTVKPINPINSGGGVVTAIHQLGNKIVALAEAGAQSVNALMYQFDKNLPTTVQANTAKVKNLTASQLVIANAYKNTQKNVTNSLQQFSYAVAPPTQGSAAYEKLEKWKKRNSPVTLTRSIKASDSLYSDSTSNAYQAEVLGLSKPKPSQLHNNYFNFGTLIAPTVYTKKEATAANRFIQYATKDYRSLTKGLKLGKLYGQKPSVLAQFANSSAWQKYQLTIRSLLAARSIVLGNFNHLVAERTPVKGLGKAAGLPNKNASPLEVEKYIATHRIHSKKWYQEMSAASPATINRETLFILAEIEAQNYRAHLDRERVLSTMNLVALEIASAKSQLLKIEVSKVNSAVSDAINPQSATNNSDSTNQQQAKEILKQEKAQEKKQAQQQKAREKNHKHK